MNAAEAVAALAEAPTLDEVLRRDPRDLSLEDARALIALRRQGRAFNIAASGAKTSEKKEEEE